MSTERIGEYRLRRPLRLPTTRGTLAFDRATLRAAAVRPTTRRLLITVILALGIWQSVAAQTPERPFADLGRYINQEDTIFVTTRDGREIMGKLESLSPSSLVIVVDGQARDMPVTEINLVEKRENDPLWNGTLIGAAVMLPMPLTAWATVGLGTHPVRDIAIVAVGVAIGAVIGAFVDRARWDRTLVYAHGRSGLTQASAGPEHAHSALGTWAALSCATQQRVDPGAGTIREAITREAIRLAADGLASSAIDGAAIHKISTIVCRAP